MIDHLLKVKCKLLILLNINNLALFTNFIPKKYSWGTEEGTDHSTLALKAPNPTELTHAPEPSYLGFPPPGILMPQSLCRFLPAAVIFTVQLPPPDRVLSWMPSAILSLSSLSSFYCFWHSLQFLWSSLCCPTYKWHEGRNRVCFHIKLCLIHCKYSKIFWTNGGINYY